ncbi:MAG: hypothetical protein KAJ46_04685, partial [Sedimentisphaerales bacterium]|nr:hypothetical protein [Sedimentisphaerales bacterium]
QSAKRTALGFLSTLLELNQKFFILPFQGEYREESPDFTSGANLVSPLRGYKIVSVILPTATAVG